MEGDWVNLVSVTFKHTNQPGEAEDNVRSGLCQLGPRSLQFITREDYSCNIFLFNEL